MKSYKFLFLLLSLSFVTTISVADPISSNTGSAANASSTDATDAQKNDAQTLKSIMIIDDNEVNAGYLALKKSQNADVKKFAQEMITQHVKNVKQAKKVMLQTKIYPVVSDQSIALETDGKNELDKLANLQGKDFDTAYINAMVDGHKKVSSLLTDTLIPKASNPQLVSFLKSTSAMVSHHLEMAEQVQKQLQ